MAFNLANIFSFQWLLDFIFGNIVWLIIIGGIIFVFVTYLKFGYRHKIKPLNRSEIEQYKFIERMKNNQNSVKYFKILKRGEKTIGKITHFCAVTLTKKGNPKEEIKTDICMMLVKPMLISRGRLQITNPLGKVMPMQINKEFIKIDPFNKTMNIPEYVYLDYYFGIYYDKQTEDIQTAFIKNDQLFRTDLNQIASVYFAKSQEQATFDPEHAHQLAMKEKEIQVELAKKSGKITAI